MFKRIDHVALDVTDIDRSVAFMENISAANYTMNR